MDFPAWDPVLFSIPFVPFDARWYGLMYVVGFVFAQWAFVRLAKRGFFPVPPEAAPDLIFYCVIGVMLGGRTGYALFYEQSLLNPLEFLQVWKGGLAFHGGLAGVGVAMWLYSRHHKVAWGRLVDSAALAVCPGIFAVRFANFINGELFGREATKDTFGAMQFPTDPVAMRLMGVQPGMSMRDRELIVQMAYGKVELADVGDQLTGYGTADGPFDWQAIATQLAGERSWENIRTLTDVDGDLLIPYRHPSQLYEGLGEGLLLGIVMLVLYLATRNKPLRRGNYGAIFMLGYAAVRILLERVRKPDDQFLENGKDGTVLFGMTMGQTLSVAMILGALLILFWPRDRADEPRQGGDDPGAARGDGDGPAAGGGSSDAGDASGSRE